MANATATQDCSASRVYIGTHQGGGAATLFTATFDGRHGVLSAARPVAAIERPTWLLNDPGQDILYSVSEIGNDGKSQGAVFSLRIDTATGDLVEINHVSSGGGGPTHLALDQRSRTLFVANYGTGHVAVIPIGRQGQLDATTSIAADYGSGPSPRQTSPHAHGVTLDPTRQFVLVPDLGADRVFIYRISGDLRTLQPEATPFLQLPPGTGPRHLVFSADGRHAYLLNEFTADLNIYGWDAARGTLHLLQSISTLSAGHQGKKSAGEIVVSHDGRRVYLSNRGEDTIITYAVANDSGELTEMQRMASGGKQPWHLTLSPDGRWLLAANEISNSVNVFAVDKKSGRLSPTNNKSDVATPVNIVFAGVCSNTEGTGL